MSDSRLIEILEKQTELLRNIDKRLGKIDEKLGFRLSHIKTKNLVSHPDELENRANRIERLLGYYSGLLSEIADGKLVQESEADQRHEDFKNSVKPLLALLGIEDDTSDISEEIYRGLYTLEGELNLLGFEKDSEVDWNGLEAILNYFPPNFKELSDRLKKIGFLSGITDRYNEMRVTIREAIEDGLIEDDQELSRFREAPKGSSPKTIPLSRETFFKILLVLKSKGKI